MRTILAPGVEWREIDRSGYSPAMTGTGCYVPGFANKGEAYKPIEFTSRSAWISYYGEPDTEAERYFYAAACEVLNQNGRLICARLPYSNDAFEKMVGVKYTVKQKTLDVYDPAVHSILSAVDAELNDAFIIEGGKDPIAYDLDKIDEYRTDEAKVPANTFLIVDTTGGTYAKVTEDSRKGKAREVIGLVPVVTTAANAMYAQSLLNVSQLSDVQKFEAIAGTYMTSLSSANNGLSVTDCVVPFNTSQKFSLTSENYITSVISSAITSFIGRSDDSLDEIKAKFTRLSAETLSIELTSIISSEAALSDVNEWGNLNDIQQLSANPTLSDIVNTLNSIIVQISYNIEEVDILQLTRLNEDDQVSALSPIISTLYTYANSSSPTLTTLGDCADAINGIIDNLTYPAVTLSELAVWSCVYKTKVILDSEDCYYADTAIPSTIALDANNYFATIQPASDGIGLDPEHLKDIGVVVYRMYLDPAEGNKVSYEPVEAYCGSLYKDAVDPNTGVTKFIDTLINSQSKYINFFSNCFSTTAVKKAYLETCDILIASPSNAAVLGFYSDMTKEDISVSQSILDGLNKSFDKVSDILKLQIDLVCDAGIANIASYLKAIFGDKGPYDLSITDDLGNSMLSLWKCTKSTDASVMMWKTVEQKMDTFCKKTRKDCMFIADGMRPLVLQGQKKIIRDSKPKNTLDVNIIPYLPAICGLNTNFGAGYCDWFQQADDYTGDFFWCPPSIKAMGIYINTDVNFNYWDAPAGLNRGVIAATDVAFSPTPKQAGCFYEKNWNFAINYPNDGIVLEGQKTLQVKPSAFDRVNVRRLFLRLERASYMVSRYFVYEPNTAFTRQRLVDAIDPYFRAAKTGGGIYDYKIVCDDSNNTPDTIDRNELHVSIGIKPTKTIEFIMIDFIAGSTGGSWEEIMG